MNKTQDQRVTRSTFWQRSDKDQSTVNTPERNYIGFLGALRVGRQKTQTEDPSQTSGLTYGQKRIFKDNQDQMA